MSQSAPFGWRLQHHSSLESTQDAAIEAARAGDRGRLAILADEQTAGRGSRGRAWVAPAGNLNLSVLLRPQTSAIEPGRWALMAGVALHEALAPFAGSAALLLKWPNDVLLGGGKLGGILIDSEVQPNGQAAWVVIGMGANLAEAPIVEGRVVASLPGPAPAAKDIAARVLDALEDFAGLKMEALVEAWMTRAHPIGTMLDVQTPQRRLTGTFAGLNAQGALLLQDQATPITSAEIFPHQEMTGGLGGMAHLPQFLPCS